MILFMTVHGVKDSLSITSTRRTEGMFAGTTSSFTSIDDFSRSICRCNVTLKSDLNTTSANLNLFCEDFRFVGRERIVEIFFSFHSYR